MSPPSTPKIAVIAEDDEDFRQTLTDYLTSQNFRVLSLAEVPDTDDLRRLQPNLFLVDLLFGDQPDGIDTLRRMSRVLNKTSIVVMSGDAKLIERRQDELNCLASAVLLKPFDLDLFDQAIGICWE